MIDVAWEQRILPALSEYTRIPCLSPAFDPDWVERGAIAEAAVLLRDWAQEQDPGLATEIVQLPGRTPLLLIENGGSGDPILLYGHMDKQPPLGDWRPGSRRSNRFARGTSSTDGARQTTDTHCSPP